MTIIFTEADFDELWQEGLQTGEIACKFNDFEYMETWQHALKKGSIQILELRPGLCLQIGNYETPITWGDEAQHSESFPLTLAFIVTGGCREQIYGIKEDNCEKAGENYLFFLPGTREIEVHPTGLLQNIRIRVESHLLRTLTTGQENSLPDLLKPFMEADSVPLFHQDIGKMTSAMHLAVRQIMHCPYQGMMRRVYLEAKTLELIALQFSQLVETEQPTRYQYVSLKRDECDRIYQAREILINNLHNPPSLITLAQQVGLNERKLKQGFRHVFGNTVFGYLHDYQMQQAQRLLLEEKMTVAGVAARVGYASPTAFCAAFRRKFGINPKAYQIAGRISLG
ncbi:AraC family transcriptional regulator [Calothrix sp. PCC 7507]|uniref:helix-turn-helix transcriptional regulator n=1 Tax=Calothrix sp. PCC 7507 TaxID=99598 RepID=UPI00029F2997|nr:AraC family transcriptional regulator [Calothrix sp. PCC 7507]AFY34377.1 transcriptional regulator, AraC family [Calothrix sp. PCC 7507]